MKKRVRILGLGILGLLNSSLAFSQSNEELTRQVIRESGQHLSSVNVLNMDTESLARAIRERQRNFIRRAIQTGGIGALGEGGNNTFRVQNVAPEASPRGGAGHAQQRVGQLNWQNLGSSRFRMVSDGEGENRQNIVACHHGVVSVEPVSGEDIPANLRLPERGASVFAVVCGGQALPRRENREYNERGSISDPRRVPTLNVSNSVTFYYVLENPEGFPDCQDAEAMSQRFERAYQANREAVRTNAQGQQVRERRRFVDDSAQQWAVRTLNACSHPDGMRGRIRTGGYAVGDLTRSFRQLFINTIGLDRANLGDPEERSSGSGAPVGGIFGDSWEDNNRVGPVRRPTSPGGPGWQGQSNDFRAGQRRN